jgi:hypothetical protein
MPITDTGAIESIRLNRSQRERLITQLREHYAAGIAARGDWPTRHDDHYRRYLADWTLRPAGPWPGAPRLFTSHTRRTMEKIWGDLWKACFPGYEALSLDPLNEPALERYTNVTQIERWTLRYAINDADQGGWAHIGKMALFDALLDATGFMKVYPWRLPWNNAVPDTLIRIDNVDEGTLILPPGATGTQYPDAEYIGQELYVRWDDLVRKKRQGFTVPDKKKLHAESKPLTERERTEAEREGHQVPEPTASYKVVEMYERFVLKDPDDDPEDDLVISWYPDASDEDCLGRVLSLEDLFPNQPRPTRPFFPLTVWAQPRQLRGLSVPERTRTPQDMLNRLAEQTINYGDVSILPFYFYNAMLTGEIPDLRQVMPGQGVPVNDVGGVTFSPRSSLNRHFMEQAQAWGAEIEADLHVSDISLGRQPTRPNAPRTLGGTMLILQQGREAFSDLVEHLGAQFSAPLDFHWRLWQHFIPPNLKVPLKHRRPGARGRALPQHGPLFDEAHPFLVAPPEAGAATGGGAGAGAVPGLEMLGAGRNGSAGGTAAGAVEPGAAPPLAPGTESVLEPEQEVLLEDEVTKEDLQGTYVLRLTMNPELPFDRQVVMQLGGQMLPILLERYPIGARLLLKRMWEINGQRDFDQIYPQAIAMLETQLRFTQVLMQQQAQEQQMAQQQQMAKMQAAQVEQAAQGGQQPPQGPPGPSPETQALMEAGDQHRVQHEAQQREHATQQAAHGTARSAAQAMQAFQKLQSQGQDEGAGTET